MVMILFFVNNYIIFILRIRLSNKVVLIGNFNDVISNSENFGHRFVHKPPWMISNILLRNRGW